MTTREKLILLREIGLNLTKFSRHFGIEYNTLCAFIANIYRKPMPELEEEIEKAIECFKEEVARI